MTPVPFRKKLTRKTLIQSVVLGLVGGPIVWLYAGPHTLEHFGWCVIGMALAPPLVDLIRPTYYQ
jgi:hypothetical protein